MMNIELHNMRNTCTLIHRLRHDAFVGIRLIRLLSAAVMLVSLATEVDAQAPLPQSIVDAWTEGGCHPLEIWVTDSGFGYDRAFLPKEAELIPAFRFSRCQRLAHLDKRPRLEPLRNLPIPSSPFGLFISVQDNDDFKDVERFHETLYALNLERNVTCEVGGPRDLDLKLVGKIASLRHLAINGWPVSDRDLQEFGKLRRLQTLVLFGTVVTYRDDAESRAANHQQITRLGSKITDAGIERLSELEDLETLSLGYSNINTQGLQVLTGLKRLRVLRLQHNSISDESLQILAKCEGLEILDLSGTKVTGTGFQFLSSLPRLSKVMLHSCPVTDEGLEKLQGLSSLQTIYLQNTMVSEAGVKKLQESLPKVKVEQ